MPKMANIMRKIRQNPALGDTPVIFLVESEFQVAALEKGYFFGTVDYIFEPIVPCVLKAKAAGYLSLYEKTQQVEQLTAQLQAARQHAAADITEMRLRERQRQAIFESTLDAIAIADDEGRYVEVNPAACKLFGLPLSELLGKRISDFMMSDFDFEGAWRAFLANGQGTGELHLRRRDGTVRQVEWVAKANFLPGRHLSALRDITERRQAEVALRDSQRLLRKIADTTPTLLYIYELPQVRNIYINRYGADFFGSPPEEIQAQGRQFFASVLPPEHLDKIAKLQERFANAKNGEIIETEFPMRNAKGEWRWLHTWEIIFTRNAEGIPEQILGTAIDITEQRNASEVRHALEAEQELRKRQLRFFSTVSHEFRTPLTSILGVAELLDSHALDWPDEKIARNVQRLKKAARHLHQLLDVLLTINRAESGKLDFQPRPIAPAKFCRNLIRERQLTTDTKHRITFRCQGQCQNAVMDEKLLYFTLTNLLSNATKYSPNGSKVQVTLTCNPSEAIFRIQDSGIGIPEADRQHLFELFHRGRNSEEIPGTGLGLCLVKTCLDLQGGTIAIDSEVGVGTTVTVTLPLVAEGQRRCRDKGIRAWEPGSEEVKR
jgi:PAS domain S-box-containing protein